MMDVITKAASVALVVFDFDGVFTDNRVYVTEDGRESVVCNRSDGIGIKRLREIGVDCLVLSQESNPVVSARCQKLGVQAIQGCEEKGAQLALLAREKNVSLQQVAYLGNDINDIPCLKQVGLPACVADAYTEIKALCEYETRLPGGAGAVREFCDLIVHARTAGHDVSVA